MKQFFYLLFGGLLIVGGSLGISYGAGKTWQALGYVDWSKQTSFLANIVEAFPQPTDGTTFNGLVRLIRYTAVQEEDAADQFSNSLPKSVEGPVTASAFVVKSLSIQNAELEHNADVLLPVASLTKLVTAAVARKVIDDNEHVVISKEIIDTYGNTAAFRSGEVYLAKDIYYPLLMVSSNDAAEALARTYGRKAFVQAMNDFTQSIGAYRSYFVDPSGLSPLNKSTANDMAIILNWIRQNDPTILEYSLAKTKTVGSHTWNNPTHFLNWSNYAGGKNGYIPESDKTAAAIFSAGAKGELYAVVVLGSSYRDGDVFKLLSKIK